MTLGDKIKEYRQSNNMTQDELGAKLFVTRQAISKWEQGKGYPSVAVMESLSRLMNVTIDELLSSEETKVISLGASAGVKRLKKNNIIALGVVALFLITVTIVFFTAVLPNITAEEAPRLRGIIGFYIDTDLTDGEITLDGSNEKDVYIYVEKVSDITDRAFSRGVGGLDNRMAPIHTYTYITAEDVSYRYIDIDGIVYLNSSKITEYNVYSVIQKEDYSLSYEIDGHFNFVSGLLDISFGINDRREIDGHYAGCRYNVNIAAVDGFDDLRLLQFDTRIDTFPEFYEGQFDDSLIGEESVLFEDNLESGVVTTAAPIYAQTESCALYKVQTEGGRTAYELYKAYSDKVAVVSGSVQKPKDIGYDVDEWVFGACRAD